MSTLTVTPTCTSCGHLNRRDARFCGHCGLSLDSPLVCGLCSTANRAGSGFCNGCGSPLADSPRYEEASAPSVETSQSSVATGELIDDLDAAGDSRSVSSPHILKIKEWFGPQAIPFMLSGTLLVFFAQWVFFTEEFQPTAPRHGVYILVFGMLLFALGAYAYAEKYKSENRIGSLVLTGEPTRMPLFRYVTLFWGVGAVLFLVVLVRSRSDTSTLLLDLFMWFSTFVIFAIPLMPRIDLRRLFLQRSLMIDVLIVAGFMTAFIVLNARDATDWYYSVIGDEYLFYEHAERLFDEPSLIRMFSQNGVYHTHSVMVTVYQALVMAVFGWDHFGWVFSSILCVVITIPAVYISGRLLSEGRVAAVVAVAILSFSHYLFAFSHIGYDTLTSLPTTAWTVALFLLGSKKRSWGLLLAAGILAGFNMYAFSSARVILPVIGLFVLISVRNRQSLINLWPMALGFVLSVAPTLLSNQDDLLSGSLISRMLNEVVGGYSEGITGDPLQRIRSNLYPNLLAFNFSSHNSHFVSGSLLDVISGGLAMLGIGLALGRLKEQRMQLLLIWLILTVTAAAVLSPYPHVPVTRLHIVLLPLALLAGLSVSNLAGLTGSIDISNNTRKVAIAGGLVALSLAVLLLNVRQFWTVTPSVYHTSSHATALMALHSNGCDTEIERSVLVSSHAGITRIALESHYPDGPYPTVIGYGEIDSIDLPNKSDFRCVVFSNPWDGASIEMLERLRQANPAGRVVQFHDRSQKNRSDIFIHY